MIELERQNASEVVGDHGGRSAKDSSINLALWHFGIFWHSGILAFGHFLAFAFGGECQKAKVQVPHMVEIPSFKP